MAYTYDKTQWNTGDPITQEKMNKIENGIAGAYAAATTNESKITTNETNISNLNSDVTQAKSDIQALQGDVSRFGQAAEQGVKAWTQVQDAIQMNGDTVTKSLGQRFSDVETRASNILIEIQDAHRNQNDTLDTRFDDMDSRISEFNTDIQIINNKFTTASKSTIYGNYGSVDDRFEAEEQRVKDIQDELSDAHQSTAFNRKKESDILDNSYATLDARLEDGEGRIVALRNEMDNAHESTVLGKTGANAYSSLDERLEAIEGEMVGQTAMGTRLDTIETDVSSLSTGKVNKSDIANNLTTETAGKVLDATQGKALKDAIDTIDGTLNDEGTGLVDRIEALETEVDMTSANSRIDLVESEVTNARTSSVIRTPGANDGDPDTDTTYASLDARLEAIEGRASNADTDIGDLRTDVNTIADELNMYTQATHTISGTNSRIDQLEANMVTMANEIGMLQDGETVQDMATAITGANTRIDTIDADLNTASTGIKARLDAIDNASTGAIVGLDARLDAIDGGTALTGSTLATRVTTLEGKDTIIVDYDGEHSNYTNDEPNLSNPSESADYLIANDNGKYFYWRYFGQETGWQLVGGAGGGSGSSSGIILAELPAVADGNPNTDYFIGTDALGYTHYRFIPGENDDPGRYVIILPKNLISDLSVDSYGGLVAHSLGDNQTNLLADFYALNGVTYTPNYDPNDATQLVSQTLQFTGTDGQPLDPIVIVGGGGGGGSVYTVRIETTTDIARSIPANNTDPVTIRAKVVMKQGTDLVSGATATGQIQYRQYGATTWNNGDQIEVEAVEESLKYTIQNDTYFTVDVTKYLETDKTIQIRLVINAHPESENETVVRYQTFSVSKVNISIADESFDYASVKNGNFQFNYRCFGSGITKIVHFLVDGADIVTPVTTTTHNTVLQQVIPMTGKTNGMHTFQVYFITNTGLESNRLNYYILYNTDTARQAPLIGAAAANASIVDGDELVVNYSVSTADSETTDQVEIELYTMDNGTKNTLQLDTLTDVTNNIAADPPYRTFNYPRLTKANSSDPDPDPITVYVKLTASHTVTIDSTPTVLTDSQVVSVTISYLSTKYTLEPEGTNNLLYEYVAYGRSNNNVDKDTYTYEYTNVDNDIIEFTGSFNNFNWATDGYVDGESLLIGGGATHTINVPIFSYSVNGHTIEENANIDEITQNGRTIEIDYEVLSATNMNATIIDCMDNNNIGFRVTPQSCYLLNSSSNIDIDETGFIKNEENVAAAYLAPGTRTHLTFVIEPWAASLAADGNYHQSTNIYINGEFANACPYNRNSATGFLDGNNFSTNATITIGDDSCLIKLYSIKLYNRGLTEAQVLHNYEVAPVFTRQKLTRLEDNDVLNAQGLVDYEKARKKYTCLLLTGSGTVNGVTVPTMAPYKGYPSPMGRIKDGETVGKTESALLLTKPSTSTTEGYVVEFDLHDKLKDPNGYGYASSNNVQGTSSQKFPVKNLKVYLAKGKAGYEAKDETVNIPVANTSSITTAVTTAYQSVHGSSGELPAYVTNCASAIQTIIDNNSSISQAEVAEAIVNYITTTGEDADVAAAYVSPGDELGTDHPIIPGVYTKSDKVKYALRGSEGLGDSTLCWKADYMSTDHANTFNANIVNKLYTAEDRLSDRWTDKTQFAVYGIKCLLFQKAGDGTPVFVGDGCLNNDKGNHGTFGLETKTIENVWPGDDGNDTMCQKWDFRNNTNSILYFKHDGLFKLVDGKPDVSSCIECIYPDEGDLADEQAAYMSEHNNEKNPKLDPNYNHFQILSSWVGNRANYWYESSATLSDPITYNGQTYTNLKDYKKAIFRNEFTRHFNLNHMLIYYLFLEYTALVDNRVKNIHMRTDNAGLELVKKTNGDTLFEGNSNPNLSWWSDVEDRVRQEPIMDENGNYQYDENDNMILGNVTHSFFQHVDDIDWEVGDGHSNFAIWAPVLYDLDSCFGAENVGFLRIRYDADWDYKLYGKLQQAGYDSILWFQFADCFDSEIKAMAKTLYNRTIGLNYATFYRYHITDNLVSLSPAITNQDMILKFEEPWTNGFLDYSKDPPETSTDEYKYLQRGTRTSQKITFMKQRSMLLSSKYDANEFKKDLITFRAGTVVNEQNTVITLTANQKLYHGVQFGDLNDVSKVTRRAYEMYDADNDAWVPITTGWVPEFTPCRLKNNTTMQNSDGIEIYGASVLNDIGDLSKFHPYQLDVGNAVNLKKLVIGSSNQGYSNTATIGISGLNSCALLEEINVCNLKNLNSLSLSNNGFIKKVYATGSGVKTLSLPAGGVLDTIAYGENTTDITIINQGSLTNFSYENSSTNNYGNVTRLWIENTPNVPIVDIITARLTPLASDDRGLRAGGLRIIGLDLNLGSDVSFLQLIASNLVNGTYLSSKGGHTESNEQPPEISGTVRVTRIRSSLYNTLREMYPHLTVIYNQKDEEYDVTYKNWDGTVLYVDHGISTDPVIDPVYDTNPITNAPYISMPTKPEDIQYKYKFGTYDNQNRYRRFSGWVRQGTTTNPTSDSKITGTLTYIAYYPTLEDQYYTVQWFGETTDSDPLLSYYQKYGTPIGTFTQPEETDTFVRAKQAGNGVKVFKGWSRPVGKLTGNINVYAQWENSTINNDTEHIVMSQLSAADIYALATEVTSERKDTLIRGEDHIGEPIFIKMGQEFDYTEGATVTNLVPNGEKIVFEGNRDEARIYNTIRPLSINQDWTLALDYQFLLQNATVLSSSQEFVLASCYQNANSSIQGFKLSLVRGSDASTEKALQVTWGTQTQVIDYITIDNTYNGSDGRMYCKSYRNMVVLAHNADNPNNLVIYYAPSLTTNTNCPIAGADYGDGVVTTTLTWNTGTIDVPLILGGNYNGATTEIESHQNTRRPAQGIIYWGKYWDVDLGGKACAELAAWPHETVPFYLSGYNGASGVVETIYEGAELSFVAAQGIGSKYSYSTKNGAIDEDNYAGWHASRSRHICNNLIYKGMPTAFKSIIRQTPVASAVRFAGAEITDTIITDDYLFLPAQREVDSGNIANSLISNEVYHMWNSPWHWMIAGNIMNVYGAGNISGVLERKTVSSIHFYRYRFSGNYIKPTSRIYNVTTDPATTTWTYNSTIIEVQSGDVWINPNDNIAYMYFTNEEIAEGAIVDRVVTNGGWKRADLWNLRTYNLEYNGGAENCFKKVGYMGELLLTPTPNQYINEGRLLCPEFTV